MKRTKKLDKLAVELSAAQKIQGLGALSKLTISEMIKQLQEMKKKPSTVEVPSWMVKTNRYTGVVEGQTEKYPEEIDAMLQKYVAEAAIAKLKSTGEV